MNYISKEETVSETNLYTLVREGEEIVSLGTIENIRIMAEKGLKLTQKDNLNRHIDVYQHILDLIKGG